MAARYLGAPAVHAAAAAAAGMARSGTPDASSQMSLGSDEESGEAYKPWPWAGDDEAITIALDHQDHAAALAALAAPSKHQPFTAGYMPAAELARLDAFDSSSMSAGCGSGPSSLLSDSSAATSECGDADMPCSSYAQAHGPAPGAAAIPAAAAAARALSRLGGAAARQLPRPDSAASFLTAAPSDVEMISFNWSQKSSRQATVAAMETLVTAMADDPVNSYLLGGTPSARFARKEIKGYLKALPKAAHFMSTHDAAAVALWQLLPQETPKNELLAGWTRIFRVPLRLWPALVALELRYEAAHAREAATAPGGCYYYLSFIGTAPAARGKGYASLLMRHTTSRSDQEGRICLLEGTSDKSRVLYERHGFAVYETYRVTPDAPPVYFMRRNPQPPQQQQLQQTCRGDTPLPHAPLGSCLGPNKGCVHAISSKAAALEALGGGSEGGCESEDEGSLITSAVVLVEDEEHGGKGGEASAEAVAVASGGDSGNQGKGMAPGTAVSVQLTAHCEAVLSAGATVGAVDGAQQQQQQQQQQQHAAQQQEARTCGQGQTVIAIAAEAAAPVAASLAAEQMHSGL